MGLKYSRSQGWKAWGPGLSQSNGGGTQDSLGLSPRNNFTFPTLAIPIQGEQTGWNNSTDAQPGAQAGPRGGRAGELRLIEGSGYRVWGSVPTVEPVLFLAFAPKAF